MIKYRRIIGETIEKLDKAGVNVYILGNYSTMGTIGTKEDMTARLFTCNSARIEPNYVRVTGTNSGSEDGGMLKAEEAIDLTMNCSFVEGSYASKSGGAVAVLGSYQYPTLKISGLYFCDCFCGGKGSIAIFKGNPNEALSGGALFCETVNVTIEKCDFSACLAGGFGGAMALVIEKRTRNLQRLKVRLIRMKNNNQAIRQGDFSSAAQVFLRRSI